MKERNCKANCRLGAVATLSVAVAVFSLLGAFAYLFLDREEEREVIEIPSFTGRQIGEMSVPDEIVIERELVFSDSVSEGVVISQFPLAGALRKIRDGERYPVRLTVSMGREEETVPDLKHYTYSEAAAALRSLGAGIRIVSVYDSEAEADEVLHTSPEAGEALRRGDRVTLFVARRHIKSSVRVPALVGLRLEDACLRALSAGLVTGEIAYEYSEEYGEGTVVAQSRAQDSYVLYGAEVDLVVSLGREKENLHPFGRYITENQE